MKKVVLIIGLICVALLLAQIENQTVKVDHYYYSIAVDDPTPYMEKTMLNKTNVWFEFKDDEWRIDWDAERMVFDKIFLHYAKNQSIDEMNEIFKAFYIKRFNSSNDDPYVKGLEPHSGHVFNNNETYLVYHYIIDEDGQVKQTLSPLIKIENDWYIDQVAWHAGNWTDNCRSISICLISDDSCMSQKQMESLNSLIKVFQKINPDLKVYDYQK